MTVFWPGGYVRVNLGEQANKLRLICDPSFRKNAQNPVISKIQAAALPHHRKPLSILPAGGRDHPPPARLLWRPFAEGPRLNIGKIFCCFFFKRLTCKIFFSKKFSDQQGPAQDSHGRT